MPEGSALSSELTRDDFTLELAGGTVHFGLVVVGVPPLSGCIRGDKHP